MAAKILANGEMRELVFAHLLAEADLDGIVVIPLREIAEKFEMNSHTSARDHIEHLVLDGRITKAGRYQTGRPGSPIMALRIAEAYL